MLKGMPYHSAIGHCVTSYESQIEIGQKWFKPKDLSAESATIWGETRLDLTSRDDVTAVSLKITIKGSVKAYQDAYSLAKFIDDCVFAVRVWNKSARVRRIYESGKISVPRGKSDEFVATVEINRIDLEEFSGEIECEPIIFTKVKMHDRGKKSETLYISPGTVIAWGDPFLIILEKAQQGLSSLFDFRFCDFAEDKENNLPANSFFAVRWDAKPVLFIDSGVVGLYEVMMSTSKTGKVARARDAINATIAHGAMSAVVSSSIQHLRSLKIQNPTMEVKELLDLADPQERSVLRAWAPLVGEPGASKDPEVALEAILDLDEDELSTLLSERLNEAVGSQIKSRGIVDKLLVELDLAGVGNG